MYIGENAISSDAHPFTAGSIGTKCACYGKSYLVCHDHWQLFKSVIYLIFLYPAVEWFFFSEVCNSWSLSSFKTRLQRLLKSLVYIYRFWVSLLYRVLAINMLLLNPTMYISKTWKKEDKGLLHWIWVALPSSISIHTIEKDSHWINSLHLALILT